jgi:hypothetical protein
MLPLPVLLVVLVFLEVFMTIHTRVSIGVVLSLSLFGVACGPSGNPTTMTSPTTVAAAAVAPDVPPTVPAAPAPSGAPSSSPSTPSTPSTPPTPDTASASQPGGGVVVTGGPGPCDPSTPFSGTSISWTVTVTNNEVPFRLNSYVFWSPTPGCHSMVENGLAGPTAGLIATTNVPLSGGVPNFPQGASGVVNYTFDVAAYQRLTGHCGGHLQIDLGSFKGDYVNLGTCPPPPPLPCVRAAFSAVSGFSLINGSTAEITFTIKPDYIFPIYLASYMVPGPGVYPQTLVHQTVTTVGPGPHTLDIAVPINVGSGWQVDLGCLPFPAQDQAGIYPEDGSSDLIAGFDSFGNRLDGQPSMIRRRLNGQ